MSWSSKQMRIVIFLVLIERIYSWNEVSKCTPSNIESYQDRVLNLDCGNDFIFIAWSHYGHKNDTVSKSCYLAQSDCRVNVEYISNECNGLSSCKVSLDSQYLHSCKAYSDYLFIVYKCIESKNSHNICDNIDTSISSEFYLQSPNYPYEYLNNLDCNCSLKSTEKNTLIEIELLEFDLESLTSSVNYLASSSQVFRPFLAQNLPITSNSSCLRDKLSINSDTQLCGTLKPFTTLFTDSATDLITFRLKSDDALTRRGIWIKINTQNEITNCPTNFIRINNICVKIFTQMLTWYEANTYCSNLGYSLAVIDSFEVDKQIDRALFDSNELLDRLVLDNDATSKHIGNFWLGMRQLNETNWFDFDNKPLEFNSNEKNWWPWLVTDTSAISYGSCIAKKKDFFYLQDCYKRMPFACQYKPKAIMHPTNSIRLKCGKFTTQDYGMQNLVTSSTLSSKQSSEKNHFINNRLNLTQKSSTTLNKTIVLHSNFEDNFRIDQQQVSLLPTHTSTNNSLLASLILAFLFLLILINAFVVLFILRKRNVLIKENQNEQKVTKLKHDTINSNNSSQNVDYSNQEFMDFNTTGATVSNTASSHLSYNCLANLNLNLVKQNEPCSSVYNILSNFNQVSKANSSFVKTWNPQRQSLFISRDGTLAASNLRDTIPCNQSSMGTLGFNRFTTLNPNFAKAYNNDNLGHVYETISESSNNKNCNNNLNEYGEYDQEFGHNTNEFLLTTHRSAFSKYRPFQQLSKQEEPILFDVNRYNSKLEHLNQLNPLNFNRKAQTSRTELKPNQCHSIGAIV